MKMIKEIDLKELMHFKSESISKMDCIGLFGIIKIILEF